MEKSHVSLVQKICIVTGRPFETNELLFDKRLEKSLDKHTIVGYGVSPEIQEKFDEGYMALVEIDETRSIVKDNVSGLEDVYRTGRFAFVKKEGVPESMRKNQMMFMTIDQFNQLYDKERTTE